jgi:hypothetical protein
VETVFPNQPGFTGLFLLSHRRRAPGDGDMERVGAAIVKRTYRIESGALVPDAAGEPVRVADALEPGVVDGVSVQVVTRESDVAPYKPGSDLIVLGFHSGNAAGSATVGGVTWLSRAALSDVAADHDSVRNLFGWEQRTRFAREADAGSPPDHPTDFPAEWPVPAEPPQLPGFRNAFFNAYRRRFRVAAAPLPPFQPGQQVAITNAGTTLSFALGAERVRGRLYYWCERGPDRQAYWCDVPLDEFVADTLVVEPATDRAYRVWRGVWPVDGPGQPGADSYRRLVVTSEAGP